MTAARSLARAFVAVVPPPPALDALEHVLGPVQAAAPQRLAWARRPQWHLTLQYLGRVDDVDALLAALQGRLGSHLPVVLGLGGAGAFPGPRAAAVVWVGLDQGADELGGLARAVESATGPLGHEPEARAFRPHLTIARARRPLPVGAVLAAIGDGPIGPAWELREVVLMESDTRPSGAVYRDVGHVPLAG